MAGSGSIGRISSFKSEDSGDVPKYIAHRLRIWDEAVLVRETKLMSADSNPPVSIKITLPDGSIKEGFSGKTTPMDVAMGISESLARKALVALVNGVQWDMCRPLDDSCTLKICDFDTQEGKSVLWHSTAHMLGEAMEYKYKGELCIGPPLEDGFYYDIHIPNGVKVHEGDFDDLNKRVDKISKEKRTFQRLELTKEEARNMFSYNPFKLEIINELEEGATITAYRDGPFIDLCRGPHVPQSTRVKAMICKGTGQAYWRGKVENPSLQRVYGISFPEKKLMKEYKQFIAEAAKRDHRVLGPKQDLILFNQLSPGCPFLLPHGQRIFNTLLEFIKKEYWARGYDEVQTPNLFDFDLWQKSGHAQNYKDNMFVVDVEGREFGLKPMNCPSHCLIFDSRVRSYRELPMRLADFGVLHRNELSGTLGGLTRVRRFQQDDAHIFCTIEQVREEVTNYLNFFKHVYDIFGFKYEFELSTRPENFIGEISQWNVAEALLAEALIEFTGKQCGEKDGWNLNPGDGAFYGPKVDIKIYDALRRRHQCATCQLDFQLPVRFNLQYQTSSLRPEPMKPDKQDPRKPVPSDNGACTSDAGQDDKSREKSDNGRSSELKKGFARPVIIHRAIYGSFERFFAILIEHFGGYWPFWLSPRQCIVVPVSEKFLLYARKVERELRADKFYIDVDTSDRTLGKKLSEARNHYYNVILVVGEQEESAGTVNLRIRGSEKTQVLPVPDVLSKFREWRNNYK